MKLLTHEDLRVEGIPFLHILDVKIEQNVNEHAYAVVKGEVEKEYAQIFSEHVTEFQVFTIYAGEEILFRGILENTAVSFENTAVVLEANLVSTSKLLDCTYESHSYQNCQNTYFSIIERAVGANGEVYFYGEDKRTKALVMRYNETSWSFLKRMAGNCGLSVFVDAKSLKPIIFVGVRKDTEKDGQILEYGNLRITGISENFMNAGKWMGNYIVSQVVSQFNNGIFESRYVATAREKLPIPSGIATGRQSFAGKIFTGTVQGVEADRVQVHLTEIDQFYDDEGDWWFPYSTIYSASSDSGFYCMPQVEDVVRVFFPTERPEDAFAACGPNARGGCGNKEEKQFESPTGMKVHYTKDGLCLSCKGKKVFIDLKNNGQIQIRANTSIYFSTPGVVSVNASEKLSIKSEKKVYMGVDQSFVQLSSDNGQDVADVYSGMIFVK